MAKRASQYLSLGNRAGEGWFAMRHMELVDLMSYHDVAYVEGASGSTPSDDRMVEHVLNLIDLAYRLMGGNITNRPNNIRKRAVIVPGESLNLTALMPEYHKALLAHLAQLCVIRDCARLEWSVLDWNTPAIGFYKNLGAKLMDEWTVMRVDGDALTALAETA